MEDTTRRQLAMQKESPHQIEQAIAELRRAATTEGLNGRTGAYHRQLDAVDLEAAWREIDVPVLVVRGEHDWVVGPEEQQRIVDIVNARCPGRATLMDVGGLDHVLGWHGSRADSMVDYGAGRFAPEIAQRTIEWMQETALHSTP
jgi:pimeloyl-ACP methyl ester carboxylesterase